jgi:hypothetical protein
MIKYKKINDIQSMVFVDGELVGWLEKPFRTWFRIELFYHELELPANKGHLVTPLIKETVRRIKARERRRILLEEKLKDSILNKSHIIKR